MWHRCTDDVGFLEGAHCRSGGTDLFRDHDDRNRVHRYVTQGCQHVGSSGTEVTIAQPTLPRPGEAFSGVSRALLVTDKNVAHRRRRHQRVVMSAQDCAAGHAEHIGDAQGLRLGHDSLGSGHAGGVGVSLTIPSSSIKLGLSQEKPCQILAVAMRGIRRAIRPHVTRQARIARVR